MSYSKKEESGPSTFGEGTEGNNGTPCFVLCYGMNNTLILLFFHHSQQRRPDELHESGVLWASQHVCRD